MAKVAAYILTTNGLAKRVVPLMVLGAIEAGCDVTVLRDTDYRLEHLVEYDAAIFWGYVETCQAIMRGYTEAGKPAVYLDLAYWERDTHFKVAINARHPTAYFQKVAHDDLRRKRFGVEPKPYQDVLAGRHIVLAGLSQKAAWAEKEGPWGQYEEKVVTELKKYTDLPIIYRAKTMGTATPIPGTRLSTMKEPLGPLLRSAWAVVTRHSNVAVDGLVLGVPAFAWFGVASVMALQDLSQIEHPWYPTDRVQWLNDVAYTQWSVNEMMDGSCWRHLQSEGLVP